MESNTGNAKTKKKSFYKYCFVPQCTNTTVASPNKVFFSVPKHVSKRKLWLKAAKRGVKDLSVLSTQYCCEDHFILESDTINWMEVKLMSGVLKLKPNVLPHIFDCQSTRTLTHIRPPRSAFTKRQSSFVVKEAVSVHLVQVFTQEECIPAIGANGNNTDAEETIAENINIQETNVTRGNTADKAIQCRPHFRTKSTNTNLIRKKCVVACSPIKCGIDVQAQTSPLKNIKSLSCTITSESEQSIDDQSGESDHGQSEDSDYVQTDNQSDLETLDEEFNCNRLHGTMFLMDRATRVFLGIPNDCNFLIDLLSEKLKCINSRKNVLLTLRKIRLNESFTVLGFDFAMSSSNASRIFRDCLPVLAKTLKEQIVWPEERSIRNNLPLPFRCRYSKVQSIIDCLEIEIEKPSDPVKQALTWSEYKKANTLKYLISYTPDGIINFVSTGYGGRISDSLLVVSCGYLDKLSPGMHVMADTGFKTLERVLVDRDCTLVRPPTVRATEVCTKQDVMEANFIASLRIHIEGVVCRIREFAFLRPHSFIDIHSIALTDDAITAAAGIVNTQGPFIK